MSTLWGAEPRPMADVLERRVPQHPAVRDVDEVTSLVLPCRKCKEDVVLPIPDGVPVVVLRMFPSVVCAACEELEVAEEERAKTAAERGRRLNESGIPEKLRGIGWDTLWPDGEDANETERRNRAIERCREWATSERPEKGVLLTGGAGSGKTWLAAVAAQERLNHSPIRWVSVGVLMAQLDGAWDDDERKKALKVLTSNGAVVLDDFDKPAATARSRGLLFTALDRRAQSGTTLLVTTNKSLAELEKEWGDAITSRLVGLCGAPLRYPGPDRRLELAKGAR